MRIEKFGYQLIIRVIDRRKTRTRSTHNCNKCDYLFRLSSKYLPFFLHTKLVLNTPFDVQFCFKQKGYHYGYQRKKIGKDITTPEFEKAFISTARDVARPWTNI